MTFRRSDPEKAKNAFRREIGAARVRSGMKQRELAEALGVAPATMSRMMDDPDKISLGRMRRIVELIRPDIEAVLAMCGYGEGEIRAYLKSRRGW